MTPTQIALLKECIEADRRYRSAKAAGDPWAENNHRGIEISSITGWQGRTAQALVDLGLIETVNLRGRHCHAFLGRYRDVDEVDLWLDPGEKE